MKKHPTKFAGYYVCEDGTVFRNPFRKHENGLIQVGTHMRGGKGKGYDGIRCYPSVNISIRDENDKFVKQVRYYVHRLVAETIIPNPNHLPEIDHENRIKTDNRVTNLRWCTRKENLRNI